MFDLYNTFTNTQKNTFADICNKLLANTYLARDKRDNKEAYYFVVSYKDLFEDQLTIETETAWSPMLSIWTKLIDTYIPDARLFYTAEEPGCGIYYTNDYDYVDKYVIDSWIDVESNWEASEKEVIETLQKLLNTEITDVNKLINMLYESEIEGITVNQWKYENEYELN